MTARADIDDLLHTSVEMRTMPIGARVWLFKKGIEPIWSAPENVGGVNLTLKVDIADGPDQVACTY